MPCGACTLGFAGKQTHGACTLSVQADAEFPTAKLYAFKETLTLTPRTLPHEYVSGNRPVEE
jgi:hypothetical protein